MRKNILKGFIFSLALSLSFGCASVKVEDFDLCVEMSLDRGECVKVISGQKTTVNETNTLNGQTWWEKRPTNLILPLESWVSLKKTIIKICKKYKKVCAEEISTWERSVEIIDEAQETKGVLP